MGVAQWYKMSSCPVEETLLTTLDSEGLVGCHGNSDGRELDVMCKTVHGLLDQLPVAQGEHVL